MEVEKYIEEVLGVKSNVFPADKQTIDYLPLYITTSYKIECMSLFGKDICALSINGEGYFTPEQLLKQKELVESSIKMPAVFIFDKVASYNLKRYIQRGINFIIPGKQLFIPNLMVDIRKVSDMPTKETERMMPLAQFILFYHLQKKQLTGVTITIISEMFSISYLNANRAINNLCSLNLCHLIGGKEKQIEFVAQCQDLWNKALPLLVSPVQKVVYTDIELDYTQSGINALAHYTMINDERKKYYAIGKEVFKDIKLAVDKRFGNNSIEVWKYDPIPLSEEGVVDRLSLYMIYKDTQDERIQGELKTLIEEITW